LKRRISAKIEGLRQVWAFDNRWQLLLSRVLFPRESLTVYRLGNLEILVDHAGGDANGAREVLTTPMYTEHLSQLPASGALTVLDAGANNGGFALLLKHLGFVVERLVCLELNPRTCMRLRFNLDHNIAAPHEVINAALCGRSGSLTVTLGSGDVGDSIYAPSAAAAGAPEIIRALTFDELFLESFGADAVVDLCKIDIEHAEYEVFSSPGHDLIDRCRFLIIEIHRAEREQPDQLLQYLSTRGFELLPRGSDPDVYALRNRTTVFRGRSSR
jgi:FkbM family methyltransferase